MRVVEGVFPDAEVQVQDPPPGFVGAQQRSKRADHAQRLAVANLVAQKVRRHRLFLQRLHGVGQLVFHGLHDLAGKKEWRGEQQAQNQAKIHTTIVAEDHDIA